MNIINKKLVCFVLIISVFLTYFKTYAFDNTYIEFSYDIYNEYVKNITDSMDEVLNLYLEKGYYSQNDKTEIELDLAGITGYCGMDCSGFVSSIIAYYLNKYENQKIKANHGAINKKGFIGLNSLLIHDNPDTASPYIKRIKLNSIDDLKVGMILWDVSEETNDKGVSLGHCIMYRGKSIDKNCPYVFYQWSGTNKSSGVDDTASKRAVLRLNIRDVNKDGISFFPVESPIEHYKYVYEIKRFPKKIDYIDFLKNIYNDFTNNNNMKVSYSFKKIYKDLFIKNNKE